MKNSGKSLLMILGVILILSKQANSYTEMTIDPSPKTTNLKDVFSLNIKITEAPELISSVAVGLYFDIGSLQVTDSSGNKVDKLTPLRSDWTLKNVVVNDPEPGGRGEIRYDIGFADDSGPKPQSASVTVVTIYFKAVGSAVNSSVEFFYSEVYLKESGTTFPTTFNGSVTIVPASVMQPLNPTLGVTSFKLDWGPDPEDLNESPPIACYSVEYKEEGGTWSSNWGGEDHSCVNYTYCNFTGIAGHTYYFHCQARDTEGNLGTWSDTIQTKITKFVAGALPDPIVPNDLIITVLATEAQSSIPAVKVTQSGAPYETVPMTLIQDKTYSGTYHLLAGYDGQATLNINDGEEIFYFDVSTVGKLAAILKNFDERVKMEFAPDTFNKDTLITIIPSEFFNQTTLSKNKSLIMPTQLLPVGKAYYLGSPNIRPNQPISLTLNYQEEEIEGIPESKLSIYVWNGANSCWDYQEGRVDSGNNSITTKISHFQAYMILADTISPLINNVSPVNLEEVSNSQPTISATLIDSGSGIDPSTTSMSLDDNKVEPDFDPSSGVLSYTPSTPLSAGLHTLSIEVSDKVGNKTKLVGSHFDSPSSLVINEVHNYPNPATTFTTFVYIPSAGTISSVKIEVYNLAGKHILTLPGENGGKYEWDWEKDSNLRLANGVYIYRIVASDSSGNTVRKTGKLAVLR